MVTIVCDFSSVFVTRIIADYFPIHEFALLYPLRTSINVPVIKGPVIRMPAYADSSADNRRLGIKLNMTRTGKPKTILR